MRFPLLSPSCRFRFGRETIFKRVRTDFCSRLQINVSLLPNRALGDSRKIATMTHLCGVVCGSLQLLMFCAANFNSAESKKVCYTVNQSVP